MPGYATMEALVAAWRDERDQERAVWQETLAALDVDEHEIQRLIELWTVLDEQKLTRVLLEMRAAIKYDTIERRHAATIH